VNVRLLAVDSFLKDPAVFLSRSKVPNMDRNKTILTSSEDKSSFEGTRQETESRTTPNMVKLKPNKFIVTLYHAMCLEVT